MADLRSQIREYDDETQEPVTVPEWGGVELLVKSMSGLKRSRFLKAATDDDGNVDFEKIYPQLIITTAHDPDSPEERVFTEEDAEWLNGKNSAALERVAKVAMKLSGMDEAAQNVAGKGS